MPSEKRSTAYRLIGSRLAQAGRLLCCVIGLLAGVLLGPSAAHGNVPDCTDADQSDSFHSPTLDADLLFLPSVFHPAPAEHVILRLMEDHAELFEGKTVLDIGTGSGVLSLYAAQLGATRVVATDVNVEAIACARENARRLGFSALIDARLVSPADMSAYSVIESGEIFDVVISNPPWSIILDASLESASVADTGDLGFSILRGLEGHLSPDGVAVLLYGGQPYHELMVRFAQDLGYVVRHHDAHYITPQQMRAVFNVYIEQFLASEQMEAKRPLFDWREQDAGDGARILRDDFHHEQLFSNDDRTRVYSGLIIIQKK